MNALEREGFIQLVQDEWWREEGWYTWTDAAGTVHTRYAETEQELADEVRATLWPIQQDPIYSRP